MAKSKLIRIIIIIALLVGNHVHSPAVNKEYNTKTMSFLYCERDEIRKLKDSQQENIQEKCDIEQPQKLPKNEPVKEPAKPKTNPTPHGKQNIPQNNQSSGNKVYIDGFGYVEPAEMPTAIPGTSDGDINKIVGEM